VVCESDGGDGEHPDSSGDDSRCAKDDGVTGGYRARLKSESIWEERSGGSRIATEGMAMLQIDDVRGTIARI
jgi:hypothetical protein